MRKPSLTFDTFVGALAVLGVSASVGCSKGERPLTAAPEPPSGVAASPPPNAVPKTESVGADTPIASAATAATAATAAAATAPSTVKSDESRSAPPPPKGAQGPVGATPVDGGADRPDTKKSQMACGAGTCSADMKKGN